MRYVSPKKIKEFKEQTVKFETTNYSVVQQQLLEMARQGYNPMKHDASDELKELLLALQATNMIVFRPYNIAQTSNDMILTLEGSRELAAVKVDNKGYFTHDFMKDGMPPLIISVIALAISTVNSIF